MIRFLEDLRNATRALRRSPGYVLVVTAILAIALGATALVWTAFDAVVLRPLPFEEPSELVVFFDANKGRPWPLSPANFTDFRTEAKSFRAMGAYSDNSYAVAGGEGPAEQVAGVAVTSDYFQVLGVEAERGRLLGPADDVQKAGTVVLSHDLWTRRFGSDPNVVGQSVVIDGTARTVVGVLPAGLGWPLGSEIYLPLSFAGMDLNSQRGAHYLYGVARLRAEAKPEAALAELQAIAARLAKEYPRTNDQMSAFTRPLSEHLVRRSRPTLLLLVGAVFVALLAACANLASVALARSVARAREVAVRASLGAAPTRLVREQLLESLLLAFAGAALGCLIAAFLVRSLPSWAGALPRLGEARLDLGVALLAALVAGVCGLLVGLFPALQALRRDPADALQRSGRGVAGQLGAGRVRRALVVTTTALAFVLVAGASLTVRSWNRVASIDPGFRPDGKLTFSVGIPDGKYATAEATGQIIARLLERLERLPGVERAAASFGQPFGDFHFGYSVRSVDGARLSDDDDRSASVRIVTPGYFEAMGIPLLSGRTFATSDRAGSPPVVVASARAAKELLPERAAVGRSIELGGTIWDERGRLGGEVVGVVGDVRDQVLDEEPSATLYFVFDQAPTAFTTIVLAAAPERLAALGEPARRALAELDPDVPMYRVRTMRSLIADSIAQRTLAARLLAGFAAATTLLAAIGLVGVLAAAVADRRRELAVRGSLGATPRQLVAIISKQAAWLGGTGLALGLLSSLPLAKLIQSQLYEIAPTDPSTLSLAALLLGAVIVLSTWPSARRAARVDPIVALREE